MPTEAYSEGVAALIRLGGGRVWSLTISAFGDLAQGPGETLDGPVLSAILAAMNVKPEASRVALHRLRNDGWIVSEKRGRISRHSLTPMGRAQSAAASPRIYGPPQTTAEGWQMVMLEDATTHTRAHLLEAGFAPLAPRIYVGAATARPPKGAAVLTGGDAPRWLQAQFEPPDLSQNYAALHQVLLQITRDLPDISALGTIEIAALRCLIVHNWRRILLKHPALPACLFSDQWLGHKCHVLVYDLLERIPRPGLRRIP